MAVNDQKLLLTLHIKNQLRGRPAEIVNSPNPNTWAEIKSLLETNFGDARDLTVLIKNNENALNFIS